MTPGKANEKGGSDGKVWDTIWCLTAKDGQKDGSDTAFEVHMHLLWQDIDEKELCGHLEV
jgi:hypothetical protein